MRAEAWLLLVVAVVCTAHRTHRPAHHPSEVNKGKICIGTNGRMSVPSNRDNHYRNLRDRFTNCTYVDGNLELTWLQNKTVDLSFLQHIREVTGYVLVSHVDVKRIVLPKLQIIRGRTLFKLNVREEQFALMVTMSTAFTLELPELRDVLRGSVGFYDNYNLCHVKTINWDEIITDSNSSYVFVYTFDTPERKCSACDASCEAGCWGEGPGNCQKFSKTNCSPQCYQGRCFGPNPRECCHLFCAGGCTGPKQSDCLACKNFYDDGMCTQECPPMQFYDPTTYSWQPNPHGKFAYGATCVKSCPEHLLKDSGACVRSCPEKKTAVNGECIPCNVTCPKTCKAEKLVHSGNIDSFKDCTIIDGSIEILEQSFIGFQQVFADYSFGERYPKMHPDHLEVFSTVKEITGYLNVQAYHEKFTNLSYFRNLEVIGGRQLTENSYFASLFIVKTSLKSLQLKSLKRINSGSVVILENSHLCLADLAWKNIQRSTEHFGLIKNNSDAKKCEQEGLVCDAQCSLDGCWGSGPDQCLSCQNYRFGDTCIQNCSIFSGMYKAGPKTCKRCHSECATSCSGPGPKQCEKCKNVLDGPYCVAQCPITKYEGYNKTCMPCHQNCVNGCTGPNNTIGPYGCNSCEKAIITIGTQVIIERCLQKNESCPDGYFYEWVGPSETGTLKPLAEKVICRECHPLCKSCTGYGIHEQVCQKCKKFKSGEQCKDECPNDHYANETTNTCIPCHPECRDCRGPLSTDCIKCKNMKVFLDKEQTNESTSLFNCTAICPPSLPYKIFFNELSKNPISEPYCSSDAGSPQYVPDSAKTPTIIAVVGSMVFICITIIFVVSCIYRQRNKDRKEAVKMTMVLTGCEDNEPLRPTNVKPNLTKLRIVKEGELRKGGILGFGAFGKVFKGVWVPEGENVKIPVAIKVLREDTGANTSKEFLDEAYIMASVEHPNLLQLLAVCMTNQMMLITQLMPLGCLLDYVRINKEKIGSKAFLNWCTQIARGMSYLEEKRLVHRDLAARNVLVQTPNCVKITDFGLAKLLDINKDEYRAAGGKMPIKWLALECIQHRIFTHKSDVWAFGVTIWEILSYGAKPYENISAKNVPELIEKGLKLPQPTICTLDIYCNMVSCWMLDANERPTFKHLADTFAEMARDPGRYLVIPGDKFMRLPTYSHQDEKELIKTLSPKSEDPEAFVEADEYLQPPVKKNVTGNGKSTSASIDSSLSKPCTSETWTNAGLDSSAANSKHAEHWEQEMQRLAKNNEHRHYYNESVCPSDGVSSRYCSDSSKPRLDTVSEANFDTFSKVKEAQVGNLKLNLPLDEDDYLMPSPQHNQNTSGYMDLIGDSGGDPQTIEVLNYNSFIGKTCIDNPEYLMSVQTGENLPITQTLGIPSCAESPTESDTSARQLHRPGEEESMSDHEYYNDLQRELQPLRRNETTV